jgi:hypothetical protein
MTETPNHSYNTPEKGTQDWHVPLNENFERLDADVILKGTLSNRPPDPPEDTWFLDTGRRVIYHYDGDDWNTVAGVGKKGTPVRAPAHFTDVTTDQLTVNEVGAKLARDVRQNLLPPERLEFTSTEFDHRDEYDSADHEFEVARDGVYRVQVTADLQFTSAGEAYSILLKNDDNDVRLRDKRASANGEGMTLSAIDILDLKEDERLHAEIQSSRRSQLKVTGTFSVIQLG